MDLPRCADRRKSDPQSRKYKPLKSIGMAARPSGRSYLDLSDKLWKNSLRSLINAIKQHQKRRPTSASRVVVPQHGVKTSFSFTRCSATLLSSRPGSFRLFSSRLGSARLGLVSSRPGPSPPHYSSAVGTRLTSVIGIPPGRSG